MQNIKLFFLFNLIFCTILNAGNDDLFQPKSLFTTCFVAAAKNNVNITLLEFIPSDIKEPLKALHQAHHHQTFEENAFHQAFDLCVPQAIKEYFYNNPDDLQNLCWIITHDAHNNINDALIHLPRYTNQFLHDKKMCITALLSLGANINARGTTRLIKNITPLIHTIRSTTEQSDLTAFLLDRGANIDMRSRNKTPLQWAQENDHDQIVTILYDHGAKDTETYSAKKLGWHDRGCTLQ